MPLVSTDFGSTIYETKYFLKYGKMNPFITERFYDPRPMWGYCRLGTCDQSHSAVPKHALDFNWPDQFQAGCGYGALPCRKGLNRGLANVV